MRNEDYGRISRILADGTPVELEFNIVNKVYPEGTTAYNTIAEIPGTDKKDEVVMLGGHLDSWHSATGATDNAIGCATMMEAARILKALGVAAAPDDSRGAVERRGGRACSDRRPTSKEHFGSFEHQKQPEFAKLVGLSQHRLGHRTRPRRRRLRPAGGRGGRPRRRSRRSRISASPAQSRRPAARSAAPTARRSTTRAARASGSARTRSNTTRTRITPISTPTNAIIEDDVKTSAIAIAATLYQLAMRDEMLPRFCRRRRCRRRWRRGDNRRIGGLVNW